jgi:hypothetical protein
LCDAVVVALAGQGCHLVGHQGLGSEALDDGGDVERPDVDHIGRFAARARHFVETVRPELRRGSRRGALRLHLERIDQIVLDAGLFVAQRGRAGARRNGIHRHIIGEPAGAIRGRRPAQRHS